MHHSILSYLTRPAARFAWVGALAAQLVVGLTPTAQAVPPPPLNGAKPRPFYAFAHNPNSISDVEVALKNGCNALEPDISKGWCDDYLITWDTDLGVPGCGSLSLIDWCDQVNLLAQKHTNLALVVFDIKPPAALEAYGTPILDAARNHLNANGVNLNVIYSTPSLDEKEVFNQMLGKLLPREGVQFDAMDDPADSINYFFSQGYYDNIGYGDGTSLQYGPLTRAMDRAAFLRASVGYPKCVTYAYLIDLAVSMEHLINAGVDGLIVKDGNQDQLIDIVTNNHPELRLGTREDNPFHPENEAYGIEFLTGTDGTDADIEFTLHGCKGSASITVNAGFIIPALYNTHRFESANYDWVTIPSKDIGPLESITIKNLGGALNPDWRIAEVRVSSARYLGANAADAQGNGTREYQFLSGAYVGSGDTTNLVLTPNFETPRPTIQCPAPLQVPADLNQCGAVVAFNPAVDGPCPNVIAVCIPPSGSLFPIGPTTVTCHAEMGSKSSDPCSFLVTVVDTQAPVITCPAPIVVNATSPAGAVVTFTPVATDNCGAPTIISTPASGSVFAIGDTTVTSVAKDAAQNQASCSFNIHVKGAAEQTADLLNAVTALNISKAGVKNSLIMQLNSVLASLQSQNFPSACGSLAAFIDTVNAQRNKSISTADADLLVAAANQIRAVIGCIP
jgi:hypothetical protein